jgi:hypothetical protein
LASSTAGEPPADPGGPSPDERGELERLRSEVDRLTAERNQAQAQARAAGAGAGGGQGPAAGRHRPSWRTPVAAVLIVIGCVLAPVSVLGVWSGNQVSNTSRYVENVTPLIHDPAIQSALTDKVTTQVTDKLDVQALANQVATQLTARGLPKAGTLLHSFSGSIASGVNSFVHAAVAKIVASPAAARLWVKANQTAHAAVVKALSGNGNGAISATNGNVTFSLAPFIDMAKQNLSARGLTVVNKIPPINKSFTLFSSPYLVKAQSAYRLINTLKIVLPILTLILLALGVYIAKGHRRALIGAGLGVAGSMVVLAIGLEIGRSIYLNKVPAATLPPDAAAAFFDTFVRFIKDGIRALLVLGLLVAAGGFFVGPSVTAVRTRSALASGIGWIRTGGERAGLTAGPVGGWTYDHRQALRISAVVLMVLIFVFWGQPTGLVVLMLAIVLLVLLGLIELIGRPPAKPRAAGTS